MTVIIILLGILKIVLYILLTILMLALILLAIALFWEFKYFFVCDISGNVKFNAQVTWILKIFRLKVSYNSNGFANDKDKGKEKEGIKTDFRVLWFKLAEKRDEKGQPPEESQNNPQISESSKKESSKEESSKEESVDKPGGSKPEGEDKQSKPKPEQEDKPDNSKSNRRNKRKSKAERKKSGGILKKLKETARKVSYVINYPDREIIIKNAIKMLSRFKKAFKKCSLKVSGEFGFDDPCLTGKVLGAAYAASGLTGLDSALTGDFERKTVDIKLESRGKIMLWSFVWPLAVFVLSKPVWKIIQRFFFGKEDE